MGCNKDYLESSNVNQSIAQHGRKNKALYSGAISTVYRGPCLGLLLRFSIQLKLNTMFGDLKTIKNAL